jgi:hypothetical protein
VEEGDGLGVASVFAAHSELEVVPGFSSDPGGETHERAHARLVDGLEWGSIDDPLAKYSERKPDSTSSREKSSAVCVRSLVPNEKKSATRAMRSATRTLIASLSVIRQPATDEWGDNARARP